MAQSPWQHEAFAQLSLANMDKRFLPGTIHEVDFLERTLDLHPGASIVDLGCGAGRHVIEFAKRGYQVTGIDVSPTMLQEAVSRAEAAGAMVAWRQMDLREFEPSNLGAESFDAALCLCESGFGVLGGEQSDLRFLRSVAQSLRAGGTFVLTCFNAIRKYRQLGSAFDYLTGSTHWQAPMEFGTLQQDERVYTPSEMRLLHSLAGFTDIQVCGCPPGNFAGQPLQADDIEMMVIARR